ncbi:hypothetical protein SLS58_006957 [Diplodia intermedia]|uniref:Uncharacterized protein n=1 Tax=Diplodia intermedia TaxID=856260 RepID=A0ABR3TLR4_9PEZI
MRAYDAPWKLCEIVLYDFPHDKVVAPSDQVELVTKATLASCMCEDSAVVMAGMIERVLGPFPATISEIAVRTVSDPPLTVHAIKSPPPSPPPSPGGGGGGASRNTAAASAGTPDPAIFNHYAHHIRLALPSGRTEEYAFDLTSAQYGWGSFANTTTNTTTPSNSNSHSKHSPPPPTPPPPPPPGPLVPWHTTPPRSARCAY